MTHSPELQERYSELLFRLNDQQRTVEELVQETGMKPDEVEETLTHLEDGGLVIREDEVIRIDWEGIRESYARWLDDMVDERIFFVEQVRDEGFQEYYEPLLMWDADFREEVIASEGLTKVLENGMRNYAFLLDNYHTRAFTMHQFFNEFTIAFAEYENFRRLLGPDETLERLSMICDRLLVNPFAYFAFHTEYFPAGLGEGA